MCDDNKIFIQLYSFEQLKYSDIESKMGVDRKKVQELYDNTKSERESIQKIRNKFKGKRKEDFELFEDFYNWFSESNKICGYCGISQTELYVLFREERYLPLNDALKRSGGTLEIERKDCKSNSYAKDNIILACPLCNNAKSNLISEDDWRDTFVEAMRAYYEKLLGKKLENPKPK